jgi:hypothetical protein
MLFQQNLAGRQADATLHIGIRRYVTMEKKDGSRWLAAWSRMSNCDPSDRANVVPPVSVTRGGGGSGDWAGAASRGQMTRWRRSWRANAPLLLEASGGPA